MGNVASFIKGHGKRFINRYNAQYRALKFLDREKLAKAPRHQLPNNYKIPSVSDSPPSYDLLNKDLELDNYLKNVYVRSKDTVPEKPPIPKPTNVSGELVGTAESTGALLREEDVLKGFCTLTQITEIIASHESDPESNTPEAIAKMYNLEIDKVENILKYHCVFKFNEYVTSSKEVDEDPMEKPMNLKGLREFVNKHMELSGKHSPTKQNENIYKSEEQEKEDEESKNYKLNKKAVGSK